MSPRTLNLDERIADYLRSVGGREHAVLARLRAETAPLPRSGMQLAPEQGQLLALLVELIGARRCIEVGTFTGYGALSVALALPPDGRLVACELSGEWAALARRHWAEAGVADRIELRLGPALATLDAMLAAGEAGRHDFVFIDADKTNYDGYYERALRLLRPGGLVAIDNVLWSGRVADPAAGDPSTAALKALNAKIHDDPRVSCVMVPVGDGLTLARKR